MVLLVKWGFHFLPHEQAVGNQLSMTFWCLHTLGLQILFFCLLVLIQLKEGPKVVGSAHSSAGKTQVDSSPPSPGQPTPLPSYLLFQGLQAALTF